MDSTSDPASMEAAPRRSLPPLEHDGDAWSAPIAQASRKSKITAAVLGVAIVGTLGFAGGAKIGRDRAEAATPSFPGLGRGGGLGGVGGLSGLGGGQAQSSGGGAGAAGQGAGGQGAVVSVAPASGSGDSAAGSGDSAAATSAPVATTTLPPLGALLPGLPPAGEETAAATDAPVPAFVTLGTVSAVEGRTVTITDASGATVVMTLGENDPLPAVGDSVTAGT
jgi:hypothetical protein